MSIEVSNEPESDRKWLWECFECGEQRDGYKSLVGAEFAADDHSCPDDREQR